MPALKVSILASFSLAVGTSFTLALLAFGDAVSTMYLASFVATAIGVLADSFLESSRWWAKLPATIAKVGLSLVAITGFILAFPAVMGWPFFGKTVGALYVISAVATWALIYADDHVKPQATHR